MRPTGLEAIRGIQGALMSVIAPELPTLFAQDTAQVTQMLLESLAGEWDTSAETLHGDNETLYDLLSRAGNVLRAPADAELVSLADELAAGLQELPEGGLTLSRLRARNDRLRALLERALVAVEERAERPGFEPLTPLRREMYDHLRQAAVRGWSIWDALSFRERMARLRGA